jgi:hypothetical protein
MAPPEDPGGLIEIDLDQAVVTVPPAGRMFRAALFGLGMIGLIAGAGWRTVAAPRPPAVPNHVTASVSLQSVLMSPRPSAVLQIRLRNLGAVRQVAESVSVSGDGVATTGARLGLTLSPGDEAVATATVPLRCGPKLPGDAPVVAHLQLQEAGGGLPEPRSDVSAVSLGRVAEADGLCAAADTDLPEGWRDPVQVTAWRVLADGGLTMSVTGLPSGVASILAVQADDWLLPWTGAPPAIRAGSAAIQLEPPVPGCQDNGVRAVVPTGFQLVVASPDVTQTVYAPVGVGVAQWLSRAYVRACPSSPAGPSAIRPDLDN